MKKILILFGVLAFYPNPLFAQCSQTKIHLYFGNGIFNSANDVNNSLLELQGLDLSSIPNLEYRLALNLDESKLDAILTVVSQKVNGDLSYFWNVMDGLIPMPEWLVDPVREVLQSSLDETTLDTIISDYEDSIEAQSAIVLVSHSQGNFYAEEALRTLLLRHQETDPKKLGFGNVRVASPARSQFQFPYFTFKDDEVITWVRDLLGAPAPDLDSQGSGLGPYLDPLGHSFIHAYLTNPESRGKIRQAILEEVASLLSPCVR